MMIEIKCAEQSTDLLQLSNQESNLIEIKVSHEYGRKNAIVYIDKYDAIEIINHLKQQFEI